MTGDIDFELNNIKIRLDILEDRLITEVTKMDSALAEIGKQLVKLQREQNKR